MRKSRWWLNTNLHKGGRAGWLGIPDPACPIRRARIATRGFGNVLSLCQESTGVNRPLFAGR